MLEADGVAAGAEDVEAVVLEPPQAVRLSMAAAAIPATVKVVRLMVCILVSPLLCRALPAALPRAFSDWVGTDPWLVSQSVFARPEEADGCGMESFFGRGTQKSPGPKTGALSKCAQGGT
jgi:hypothetical protein